MCMRMLLCLAGGLVLLPVTVLGQKTMFQHLAAQKDLQFTITTDWDTLHARSDDTYQDAVLEINGESWDVELRLRGVYRRKYCDFPPFQINFKKKHLRNAGLFDDFDKFKVVTHCVNNEEGQNNQYEEKLIYELYGLLTDESFRVIDAGIVYKYPDDSKPAVEARILLLEPNDELAHRLQGEESDQYNVSTDSLIPGNYNRIALFQFMVGNSDWDVSVLRNVKLISGNPHYRLVPYDFDFAAIVYPSYARINPNYPLKDFRDRIYLGQYFFEQLPEAMEEFVNAKDTMLDYVMDYPHLRKSRCREIANYLKRFFRLIESKKAEIAYGTILSHVEY